MVSDIPTIQPFTYQASTAFQERVQLANKLNEVIDALNNLGDLPDLESQITELNSKVAELEESIGNTDTSLAELENQVNTIISEVNGLLKEVVNEVVLDAPKYGQVRVKVIHEDETETASNALQIPVIVDGGISLISGTTARSFKIRYITADGVRHTTNDFVIPEGGGGTDVTVTSVTILEGDTDNSFKFEIGLSDGSPIQSNSYPFPAASELTPATTSQLGGVKIGANVKVQADGTISVDLSSYALKTEIPDVSDFVTSEDVAADYQPKGNYLTTVPIGGAAIGGVKNGGNVTINADGTMNFAGDGWEELDLSSLPTDFAENDIIFGFTGIRPNVKASSWTGSITISDYTQDDEYRPFIFMLTDLKQYVHSNIAEFYNTVTIPAISSLSLYYVNAPSVWNEGGSSTDGLFQFAINTFNGSGSSAVYAPTIHKDNITQFVHKMWRLKSK